MDLISIFCGFCLFVGIVLTAVKLYEVSIKKPFVSEIKLHGKTAIVTGANTGLGYWTALDLAKRGAHVILACRNLQKAEEAKKKILKELSDGGDVVVRHLDLSSMRSVRQFARETYEQESRLDILINNAAVSSMPKTITEEGLEFTYATNHVAPFLLTDLLLDLLKKSAPSRIVNLTSIMNTFGKVDVDDLQGKKDYDGFSSYCNTKLMNILFTKELARRLEGTGVSTCCVHPGAAGTEIFRGLRGNQLFTPFLSLFFKTPRDGAQTTLYAAVSEEMRNARGEYLSDSQVYDHTWWISGSAYDQGLSKKLWEATEAIIATTDLSSSN